MGASVHGVVHHALLVDLLSVVHKLALCLSDGSIAFNDLHGVLAILVLAAGLRDDAASDDAECT